MTTTTTTQTTPLDFLATLTVGSPVRVERPWGFRTITTTEQIARVTKTQFIVVCRGAAGQEGMPLRFRRATGVEVGDQGYHPAMLRPATTQGA